MATTDRLFTVGIPCFDGRSLLRTCIQSVVDQTFPRERVEILVADDGSTEPETLDILRGFEKDLAGEPGFFRVLWSDTNSGGAARPRNRVLEEARGEYVFFVDSDDTIGPEALERIGQAIADQPASRPVDWIAVNEVAVNGRATVFRARQTQLEVPRARALGTLTVHKIFRRAEVERQELRFDEGLPSGQDVAFSFPFILGASRFLMLGGYDFYRLTQHTDDSSQPAHLSQTADHPDAMIAKNERILRVMLTALRASSLPDEERREIAARVILPRILVRERYLQAIVYAGPDVGPPALRRLSELLADPLITDLDTAALHGLPRDRLAVIAAADWDELARLEGPAIPRWLRFRPTSRWVSRARRFADAAVIRARHKDLSRELGRLRRTEAELRTELARLEELHDELARSGAVASAAAVPGRIRLVPTAWPEDLSATVVGGADDATGGGRSRRCYRVVIDGVVAEQPMLAAMTYIDAQGHDQLSLTLIEADGTVRDVPADDR